MKKIFIIGLIALAGAAIYFGVITFNSDDTGLSIGLDKNRASEVVDKVKESADKALQQGKQITE